MTQYNYIADNNSHQQHDLRHCFVIDGFVEMPSQGYQAPKSVHVLELTIEYADMLKKNR